MCNGSQLVITAAKHDNKNTNDNIKLYRGKIPIMRYRIWINARSLWTEFKKIIILKGI